MIPSARTCCYENQGFLQYLIEPGNGLLLVPYALRLWVS